MSQERQIDDGQGIEKQPIRPLKRSKAKEELRDYFAARYNRFDELQKARGEHLTKEGIDLLIHCQFATVCDLRDLGVRDVKAFLAQKQTEKQSKK
ncbi:MAG: hypothetical protein WCV81_00445 [Microgenomates group bacterium]|jgi:hypothetical protein